MLQLNVTPCGHNWWGGSYRLKLLSYDDKFNILFSVSLIYRYYLYNK